MCGRVFAAMTRAQKKAALSIAALASRSGPPPDATGTCFSSSGPALPLASSRLGGPRRGDRPRVHARESSIAIARPSGVSRSRSPSGLTRRERSNGILTRRMRRANACVCVAVCVAALSVDGGTQARHADAFSSTATSGPVTTPARGRRPWRSAATRSSPSAPTPTYARWRPPTPPSSPEGPLRRPRLPGLAPALPGRIGTRSTWRAPTRCASCSSGLPTSRGRIRRCRGSSAAAGATIVPESDGGQGVHRRGDRRSAGLRDRAGRPHGPCELEGPEIAGVTATTADPPNGRVMKNARGEPTGELKAAQSLVRRQFRRRRPRTATARCCSTWTTRRRLG